MQVNNITPTSFHGMPNPNNIKKITDPNFVYLRIAAMDMELPMDKILATKTIEEIKSLLLDTQLQKRAEKLGLTKHVDETAKAFKNRIDFTQAKQKAIDIGVPVKYLNKCKSADDIKKVRAAGDAKAKAYQAIQDAKAANKEWNNTKGFKGIISSAKNFFDIMSLYFK